MSHLEQYTDGGLGRAFRRAAGHRGVRRHRRPGHHAVVGRAGAPARRPGVPAGLPAVRQPARRRGPDPGDVHPGVPVGAELPARHVRGLAAPHHHEPVPRHGPPARPHPHGGAARGLRPGAGRRARTPSRSTTTRGWAPTCRPRSTRCRRSSAPRWCCATSKVCPTRRSAPRSASSWAPCAAASTAVGRRCATTWRATRRGRRVHGQVGLTVQRVSVHRVRALHSK